MILAQALVTALLSGLFSGAILFALNERRDRHALVLNKMESAIEAYGAWINALSSWPNEHFRLFYDRDAALGRLEELWEQADLEERRSRMLIEIYFPEAVDLFTAPKQAISGFLEASKSMKLRALHKEPMLDGSAENIGSTSVAIVEAGHLGKARLYSAARARAHAPFLVRSPRLPRVRRGDRGS